MHIAVSAPSMTVLDQPPPASSRDFPAEWYDCASASHFWMEWRFRVILGQLQELRLDPLVVLRGLDVGCGHGAFQRQLEGATEWMVDGCDLNPDGIALNQGHRGSSFLYNIFEFDPALREKYDLIFMLDVIEHVPNPIEFVKAAKFYLKNGGHIVLNVPAIPALFSDYDRVAGHLRRYTERSLDSEITATGLNVQRLAYWGLSLVPLLALRKLVVPFSKRENVIKHGFSPPSRWADWLLRSMMGVELTLSKRTPYGTSLLAIARRES
jgi:2-polyprenyl-3-methyl-5-hydroxy-6-metoxy-1,4-benzoquinol methylase